MNVAVTSKLAAAAWAAALIFADPVAVAAQADTTASISADIPVGTSDANKETSRGLTAILDQCADAYTSVQAMHSAGTYHSISKSTDDETSHSQAKVTMSYLGPDKLAIRTKSDSAELDNSFIADGSRVTMLSGDDKLYIRMPQPDSLAAFSDPYRAGEIYSDKSGAVGLSVTGPMLITEDPYAILHEDITRYVYEGEESVGDHECHRVRFVQDDPDVVVNLWISKENWLIYKASFITSYDDSYNRVESFEEGAIARMLIMTWDEMTTDAERISADAFTAKIPPAYKESKKPQDDVAVVGGEKGFWESMVSLAAESSPEETTWSLTSDNSRVDMRLEKFAEVSSTVQDFEHLHLPGSDESVFAVAAEDGKITLHKNDGAVSNTVNVGQQLESFSILDTQASGPLLLAVNNGNTMLTAHNLEGEQVWSYQNPFAKISSITTVPPVTTSTEEAVYLTLAGKDGLRKLDANGKILFSNGRLEYGGGLKPAPAGVDRIFSRGIYKITVLDKSLKQISFFETEEDLPSIQWDVEEKTYPIVAVAVSSDSDILLQRRAENGEIAWTTMIAPKAEEVASSALHWARLRVGDSVERCLAVMLSDGQVVLARTDGKIFYRGQLSANASLVQRNGGNVVQNMAVADLDNDGVDEIYTRMDNYVLRLKTTP